ncbi:carboxypeptidase-like regulatory domain-containing protein [Aliifodinibius sp. S!AR15-10]|uniref:hypothetical protein n=1 Tax=Aliifodinibius sp. S!AR15-10 TaxID=2950437 RepID=UPI00286743EF|nr:hypothetical protein [Aliifodinibius sp. S!AR15-10]MDR8390296.1 carboxypeptidase-like regulatory domain-containing protein [Aliifodinibius sp. S!AR15-10]
MSFIFKANLCARICDECEEDLSNVKVRLYRVRKERPETSLAAANPKNTFAILSEKQVKAKEKSLLAETETDSEGSLTIELGDDQDYDGEAFEIDVLVEKAPGQEQQPDDAEPVQFTITTLQPRWRQRDEGYLAVWEYCIPSRFWCKVREQLDAWVICGRIVRCDEKKNRAVPGATVKAFDADWWQDDELGQAQTDLNGHFKIYYSRADFEQTPFPPIDVELVGGPDVYFEVELGGDKIIDEDQSDGRKPGRENRGHCFCVGELCAEAPGLTPPEIPHWERVEVFEIDTDFSTHGYAGSGKLVMSDVIDLHGNMPLRNAINDKPLKYRFLIGAWDWPGGTEDPDVIPSEAPTNSELEPIPASAVTGTKVGYLYYTDTDGIVKSEPVIVNSSDLDSDGCITLLGKNVSVVMADGTTQTFSVAEDNFLGAFRLLRFNSEYLSSPPHAVLDNLGRGNAGQAVAEVDQEPIRKYTMRFQVFDDDEPVNKTRNNKTLPALVIDNSPLKFALNLEELESDLCNPITDDVHILYTLDHPHMNSYSIKIESNSGVVHNAPPLPTDSFGGDLFFRGGSSGSAGHLVDVSSDPSCAYAVILSWNTRHYHSRRGTGRHEQILYCK